MQVCKKLIDPEPVGTRGVAVSDESGVYPFIASVLRELRRAQ
jgi:hypothetical protein